MKYYVTAQKEKGVWALMLGADYDEAQEFADHYTSKGWAVSEHETKNDAIQYTRKAWTKTKLVIGDK